MGVRIKLVFGPGKRSQPRLKLVRNAAASYIDPLLGRLLALPGNIRLGWKGLLGTNALAYHGQTFSSRTKPGPSFQLQMWVCTHNIKSFSRNFGYYKRKLSK